MPDLDLFVKCNRCDVGATFMEGDHYHDGTVISWVALCADHAAEDEVINKEYAEYYENSDDFEDRPPDVIVPLDDKARKVFRAQGKGVVDSYTMGRY